METITTAAAKDSEGNICTLPRPARHGEVMRHYYNTTGNFGQPLRTGFMTNKGRYCDRLEAKAIAEKAGQIIKPEPIHEYLFTENLW